MSALLRSGGSGEKGRIDESDGTRKLMGHGDQINLWPGISGIGSPIRPRT